MKCENCGIDHNGEYGSGRFCSVVCARGFSTKARREEISKRVSISLGGTGELKKKFTHCIVCGTKLKKNARKYCCLQHQHQYEKEQYIKYWDNVDVFSSLQSARKYLLYTTGNKCSICGLTEWNGKPIPLVMDHIDGNSDNHKKENCRLVCRNCDGLLPTFSGKNHGKGRYSKRMLEKRARVMKGMSW